MWTDITRRQHSRAGMRYPDPETIDYTRDNTVHDSFGNAEHKSIGEHLARMQLAIFLEEWLKRIPEFDLNPALSG